MYGRLQLGSQHAPADHAALARAQCGLCAHFGARYRSRTRLLAGRDPSMLVLLAEALTPAPPSAAPTLAAPPTRVRCPLRLGLAHRAAVPPDWSPLAAIAALQVVLAAEKLGDDVRDRDRTFARLAARLLARDVTTAEGVLTAHDFPLTALRAVLARQADLETSPHADLDGLAAPTGEALALVAGWLGSMLALEVATLARLAVFGRRLGRTLYMIDALEDWSPDRARAVFNPIVATLGTLTPARHAYLDASVTGLTTALASAYEALPLYRHQAALRDATVDGLTARGRRALAMLRSAA